MPLLNKNSGQIAQLVEHGIENPGVAGSIPALPTTYRKQLYSPFNSLQIPFPFFEEEIYGKIELYIRYYGRNRAESNKAVKLKLF